MICINFFPRFGLHGVYFLLLAVAFSSSSALAIKYVATELQDIPKISHDLNREINERSALLLNRYAGGLRDLTPASMSYTCIAVQLDSRWLITARHCVDKQFLKDSWKRVWVKWVKGEISSRLNVVFKDNTSLSGKAFIYPDPLFDIALVRLEREKPFYKRTGKTTDSCFRFPDANLSYWATEWDDPERKFWDGKKGYVNYSGETEVRFMEGHGVAFPLLSFKVSAGKFTNFLLENGDSGGALFDNDGCIVGIALAEVDKIANLWTPVLKWIQDWIKAVKDLASENNERLKDELIQRESLKGHWAAVLSFFDFNKGGTIPYLQADGKQNEMKIDPEGIFYTGIDFKGIGKIQFFADEVGKLIKNLLIKNNPVIEKKTISCGVSLVTTCKTLSFKQYFDLTPDKGPSASLPIDNLSDYDDKVVVYESDLPKLAKIFNFPDK